jgi:putative ABC transport system permease protein
VQSIRPILEQNRVSARSIGRLESGVTDGIDELSNFLGLVGIIALLLGGIGVASGVHAWVMRKIDTVAVLRCLGATSRQVMTIYLVQAAVMGLIGAAIGAALGIVIQLALPRFVGAMMPVDVTVSLEPWAIGLGMALGLWIALAFALRPLIALRRVSPLQALRRNEDPAPLRRWWRDRARLVVNVIIALSVVGLAATRSQSLEEILSFSAGIGGTLLVLTGSALVLSTLARRLLRGGWPYVVRQGVANLYRPGNQTRSVVLSLGFGAFLVTTLYLVQSNLLAQFRRLEMEARGNLVFFDIQDDQAAGVDSIVRATGDTILDRVPLITMRVGAINGRAVSVLLTDSSYRNETWALRREYRSTYRDRVTASETILTGKWFDAEPARPGGPYRVSLERDIAAALRVAVGDTVTWNVQGTDVTTIVGSTREVNWQRFEPNFFAVFEPAALEAAPKMFVFLTQTRDSAVARIQGEVVRRYPNVASIDLSVVRATVSRIAQRGTLAVRFLTLFSLAMAVPVLFSAVSASRRDRIREGVLLKTLGATRRQITRILFSEYALLGVLGSLTGMVLSFGGAWLLMRFVFEQPFVPAFGSAAGIAFLLLLLTLSIGLLAGRDVFRETPMAALREV